MIFERLAIQADEDVFTLDLHPRLTVIGSLGQVEREAMVNEFVGALGSARAGVHLEMTTDAGRQLAVFRPFGDVHRVVDIKQAREVSAEFVNLNGDVDLLASLGLDARQARSAMRVSASDLITSTERDQLVRRLSELNQGELWSAATALVTASSRLDEEAEAVGSNAADAEVIERIEDRHAQFEDRQDAFERSRRNTYLVAGTAALAIIPVTAKVRPRGHRPPGSHGHGCGGVVDHVMADGDEGREGRA